MLERLRSAWRALRGRGPSSAAPHCARCPELERDRDYWRGREERTADALLASKGVLGRVATPPRPITDPMATVMRGFAVTEIDSTRQPATPGQGAVSRGA